MNDLPAKPNDDPRTRRWRALAELAGDPRALDAMRGEFFPDADRAPSDVARRDFLRLVGASLGLAGVGALAGCSRAPREHIVPYVTQPPELTPGLPLHYATAMAIDGYAVGLLVEAHEGRPTKIEGNPDHPMTPSGGTGLLEQAAVLSLYDPDRGRGVTHDGGPATWAGLVEALMGATGDGRGLHVVLEPTGSPLLADQIARVRARFPGASFHHHSPLARTQAWEGARLALGQPLETWIDLTPAKVILALDADFLATSAFVPGSIRMARDFADGRRMDHASDALNRLYVVESPLTVTGANADHRLRVKSGDVLAVLAAIATEAANAGAALPGGLVAALGAWSARAAAHAAWARAVARDLLANRGASAIVVGDTQPPPVHALAHALNAALGNVGATVRYAPSPILEAGAPSHDLAPLAHALDAGEVSALVILGGNPAYTAHADFDFAARVAKAKESVYLGSHANETARACRWYVPMAHFLESWGDARALDGTISIVQPLIQPLHGGRTPSEILAVLLGEGAKSAHDLLVDHWRRARTDFDAMWDGSLERGVVAGTAFAPIAAPAPRFDDVAAALAKGPPPAQGLEIVFRPDNKVRDGAFANNAWLQELPDPITKVTWDNAALISPATAARLGVRDGDVLHVLRDGRALVLPALISPGQADDSIAVSLGYGRGGAESVARGVGANGYALRTSAAPWFVDGASIARTGALHALALTQVHHAIEGRDDEILLHRTLDEYRRAPRFAEKKNENPLRLYEVKPDAPQQWGMTIDLDTCTGCSTCVIACQAENNVPVVGRAGVAKGREMQWLRIDRYFLGSPDQPDVLFEPMLCQHCEKAPCEYVCPVNATTHSADGLNQMVYNRCVGTRFCSNNCPYKVRRFNWFNYHQDEDPIVSLVHNPDVTVRARGVMEKCTYCVQRIREAGIRAVDEGRALVDGDVRTACEQACPTGAIVFGNLADAGSRVSKSRRNDRLFACLDDVGTIPRTRYLARIRNPNPEIA